MAALDAHPLGDIADPARLAALHRTALLDVPREQVFDRLVEVAAAALDAPVALISLVDADRQFFLSSVGLSEPWDSRRETPLSHSFCQHAVRTRSELVIEDARVHPLVADNRAVDELGAIAYAGVPLVTSDGYVLGSFCAIDSRPRQWTEAELATLRGLATSTSDIIELRLDAHRAEASDEALRRERQQAAAQLQALGLRLQAALLPTLAVDPAACRVAALYQPGERRMLVGGDFYDAQELRDGRVALIVGDVTGHGPEAAAFAAGLRSAWRALILADAEPLSMLEQLDAVAAAEQPGRDLFATVCSCWIDPDGHALTWIAAGHPPPLVVGAETRELAAPGAPPLGIGGAGFWRAQHATLQPGDAIVLYTDGLVEGHAAPGSLDLYGVEGLLASLAARRADGPIDEAALDRVLAAAARANGAALDDDVAILVAEPVSAR